MSASIEPMSCQEQTAWVKRQCDILTAESASKYPRHWPNGVEHEVLPTNKLKAGDWAVLPVGSKHTLCNVLGVNQGSVYSDILYRAAYTGQTDTLRYAERAVIIVPRDKIQLVLDRRPVPTPDKHAEQARKTVSAIRKSFSSK